MRTGASRTVVKAVLVVLAAIMMVLPVRAEERWKVVGTDGFILFVPPDWTVVEATGDYLRILDDDGDLISFDEMDAEGRGDLMAFVIDEGEDAVDEFTEGFAEGLGLEWLSGGVWPSYTTLGVYIFATDDTGELYEIVLVATGDDRFVKVEWSYDLVDIYPDNIVDIDTIHRILASSLPPHEGPRR